MTDIVFKVAPKGEGKTKWLLELAKRYSTERKVYLCTQDEVQYVRFCEKYFNLYNEICRVERLTSLNICSEDIVLMDNLLEQSLAINDITFIQRNCYRLFITIEGLTNFIEHRNNWNIFYEQLSIDMEGDTMNA